MKKHQGSGLVATNTIATLAGSPLLDQLSGQELVVYLRLLAAVHEQRSQRVRVENIALHRARGGRTAGGALKELEERKLIKLSYGMGTNDRVIEVL